MVLQAFRGRWLAGTIGIVTVVVTCVRLGLWQLDRREERQAFNALVEARGERPPVDLGRLSRAGSDTIGEGEHRRVAAVGTYDADREMLVLSKALQGTPGQHILTPLRLDDGTAILVERGFVPVSDPKAPIPPESRAPRAQVEVEGVLRESQDSGRFLPASGSARGSGTFGNVTRVDVTRIGRELPYDLRPGYVRVEADLQEAAGRLPVPLPPTRLGAGPHLGYAFQWFSFAAVFLVGWMVLVRRGLKPPA